MIHAHNSYRIISYMLSDLRIRPRCRQFEITNVYLQNRGQAKDRSRGRQRSIIQESVRYRTAGRLRVRAGRMVKNQEN